MEIIVSAEPLIGISRTSDALGRYYASIFQDEVRARILLSQLQGLGLKTFLCPYHPRLLRLFESINENRDFDICPVHINVVQYSRAMQNYGMVGFARRQLMTVKVGSLPEIALFGMRHASQILTRDFQYASLLLASIEMSSFKRFCPGVAFLHPYMTDLALANENEEFFRLFASFVHKHKAEAGLMTNNIGVLLDKLDKWAIDIACIAGPVNKTGYHMTPDQHRCEELVANTKEK